MAGITRRGLIRGAASGLNQGVFQQWELFDWPFHLQVIC